MVILPILKLGLFGFDWLCFFERGGVVCFGNPLRQRELHWFCPCENWVRFAKKGFICRGVPTSVERGSWPLRHKGTKRQTDRGNLKDLSAGWCWGLIFVSAMVCFLFFCLCDSVMLV